MVKFKELKRLKPLRFKPFRFIRHDIHLYKAYVFGGDGGS